jgi:hypothetical protein
MAPACGTAPSCGPVSLDCAGLAEFANTVMSKSANTIGSQVMGIQSMGSPGTAILISR